MLPNEIYIIHLSWGSGGKFRPVLAFIVGEATVDIYQITTKYDKKSTEIKTQYFAINDWAKAGLDKPSYVDTGTLITLPINAFKEKKPVGRLTNIDKQRLYDFFATSDV